MTELDNSLKTKTAEAAALAQGKSALEKQLAETNQKLADDATAAAARTKALQDKATTLDGDLKIKTTEAATLAQAKAALEKQLADTRTDLGKAQQLANANQSNSATQIRELTAKVAALDTDLKAKTVEAEGLGKLKAALEKDLGRTQKDLQTLQPQLEASRNEIKQNTLAIQALTKERDDLKSQLAKEQKTSAETNANAIALQTKLNEKNNLASQLQANLDKQLKTNADLDAQLKKLNSLNYEALEKQLREAGLKIKQLDQEMSVAKQDLIAKTEAESALIRREKEYLQAAKEKAEAEYKKQLQEHERQARIHDRLEAASKAEKDRNYAVALEQLSLVLQDEPNNKLALERIGLVHVARGDDAKAEEWLGRAFDTNSSNPNILVPLALAQLRQSKPQLALATTARAVALDPKNGEYQRYLGLACNELGWVDAAEAALTKALEITPNDVETAYTLATILAARASDDTGAYTAESYKSRAKKWYDKALQLGRKKDADLDAFFAEK